MKSEQSTFQQFVQSTNGNVIFSPITILNSLALLSTAANGVTYEQMRRTLYLDDNITFTANHFHEINRHLENTDEKATVSMANQIYVNEHYILNETFQSVAVEKFSCGIEPINFERNAQAARTINDYVAEKTNYKINDIINSNQIKKDTAAVQINAIYFKSTWKHKFDKTLTRPGDFYVNEKETVRVDFMTMERKFRYIRKAWDLSASVLELECTDSKYSFILCRSSVCILHLEQ